MHSSADVDTPPPPKRAPVAIFLLLFVPICLAVAAWSAGPIRAVARLERQYRQTEGQILGGRIETLPCRRTCRSGPSYRPHVAYRYLVGGREYHSERTTSLGESGSSGWAAGVLEAQLARRTAVVRYDPARPSAAYLEPSRTWPYWLLATVPLAITLVLAGAMWHRNQQLVVSGA